MSLSGQRCTARLLGLPLACLFGLLLASFVVLLLPAAASASIPTSGGGAWQNPLAQGNPLMSAPIPVASPASARAAGNPMALLALQQAELTASDATLNDSYNDQFGFSVAISGDTALVGALGKTVDGHLRAGAVYVFTRSGASWSQQAELTDPNPADQDWFGNSVALSGDTALVGAYHKTVDGYTWAGEVYVFTRSGTSWTQQAELTDPNPGTNVGFGWQVALSGETALISAWGETVDGLSQAGAAYVFTGSGASWSEQAELSASDPAANDQFASSIALSGDTVMVGVPNKTVDGNAWAGAAYVFTGSGASWSQQAELSDPDPTYGDDFGSVVTLSGDTALISAMGKTVSGDRNAGAAYVFTGSGASWSQQAELDDPSPAADDWFGNSMAFSGDTALIGTPYKGGTGAVFVYTGSGASWSQQTELGDPNPVAGDWFGYSVALAGDTAMVGATGKTVDDKWLAGAAYVDVLSSGGDDTLSSLAVSAGTLSPSFAPSTLNYSDSVANNVSSITLTPTTNDSHASCVLKVGGATVSNPISLSVGANTIDVVVTAQDGSTSETYVVTATRAAALSSDDTLSGMSVSAGTLSPTFAPTTLNYTDAVANSVSAITLTPTTNVVAASYLLKVGGATVGNPIALSVGANTIDVVVTAQDGSTSETYVVTVSRAAAALITPTQLTLKLSGLAKGALKLGKRLTATGTVTPTSLAGGKVTLTVERKQHGKWLKVTSLARTIGAGGAYSWIYKPAKKGSYRTEATIAKTATQTAAATTWRTFTVK